MHAVRLRALRLWADDVVMFLEDGVCILIISRIGSEGFSLMWVVACPFFSDADGVDCACCKMTAMV